MNTSLRILLATTAMTFAAALPSQFNMLKNGDFETGTIAPWVESGYVLASRVSQHNCAGAGDSYTYNCEHGGQSGQTRRPNGYWPGNAIEQDVQIIMGLEYLFVADVQLQNVQSPSTGNADAGLIEVFVDGTSIGSHNFGRYTGNTKPRARMAFTFTATSIGLKKLLIDFSRRYYSSSRTPTAFIDNVYLVQLPVRPIVIPIGERRINSTVNIDIQGTANSTFGLFVGTAKLPSGIVLGGFQGAWWLDGLVHQLFTSTFSSTGLYGFTVPIPNDPNLVGLELNWQGVEINTAGVAMGVPTAFSFYQ
jgi:hypothetical protein